MTHKQMRDYERALIQQCEHAYKHLNALKEALNQGKSQWLTTRVELLSLRGIVDYIDDEIQDIPRGDE